MIIPKGITGGASNRFVLMISKKLKWGIEIGYFHDPTTIPFSQILALIIPMIQISMKDIDKNQPKMNTAFQVNFQD